jgi:hypothetical protein
MGFDPACLYISQTALNSGKNLDFFANLIEGNMLRKLFNHCKRFFFGRHDFSIVKAYPLLKTLADIQRLFAVAE